MSIGTVTSSESNVMPRGRDWTFRRGDVSGEDSGDRDLLRERLDLVGDEGGDPAAVRGDEPMRHP